MLTIGALSSVTHHYVLVPANLAVLALALVVVMTLGTQRTLHVAPAVSDVKFVKFIKMTVTMNNIKTFTENYINLLIDR